jgi:integrase
MGTIFRRGRSYQIQYYKSGRKFRETIRSPRREDAVRALKQREGEVARGITPAIQAERLSFEDMAKDLIRDYEINGRRSLGRAKQSVEPLTDFFSGWRAVTITTDQIRRYVDHRQRADYANATINRELAALKRMFRLAAEAKLLSHDHVPAIPMLKEAAPRKGFFEREQFETLRSHLPEHLKPVVTVAYVTGWRIRSEVLPLEWRQVDFSAETLRLEPGTTKNDEGRMFVMTPELRAALEAQRKVTDALEDKTDKVVSSVFHRQGRRLKGFRKAWLSACQAAGVPGRLPHDLRRTAVRNLERAGVSRSVAMKMVGHKTESIYRRYAITSEADLREAARKLAALEASNGVAGQSPGHISSVDGDAGKARTCTHG